MVVNDLSREIKELILDNGKTQARLAEEAGVSAALISRTLSRPADVTLASLSEVLECLGYDIEVRYVRSTGLDMDGTRSTTDMRKMRKERRDAEAARIEFEAWRRMREEEGVRIYTTRDIPDEVRGAIVPAMWEWLSTRSYTGSYTYNGEIYFANVVYMMLINQYLPMSCNVNEDTLKKARELGLN